MRTGKVLNDPIAEAKRLYMNQKSREAKARKKEFLATIKIEQDKLLDRPDEFGIKPSDERKYKQCFVYTNPILNERNYVVRMTGLTNKQIYILQERTGLKAFPAVLRKEV